MKYNEFKALKGVTGLWTFLAYIMTYRAKEVLGVLALALVALVIIFIFDPSMAASIKKHLSDMILK